jgi:hypothetical protein
MPSHRLRSFAVNTLVVIVSLLACLALVEVAIRTFAPQPTGPSQFAFDPDRGDIPVPGQHGRRTLPGVYDYTYANNSLGLRGQEIDRTDKARERVLFLGDSFTYGVGVSDEETFAAQVGQVLKAQKDGLELVNAGNPGSGTDYALKFYRTLGTALRPRLVALFFFASCFERNEWAKYYAVNEQGGIQETSLQNSVGSRKQLLSGNKFYNWLISWSHTANLLKQFAIYLLLQGRLPGDSATTAVVSHIRNNGSSNEANIRITGILLGALRDAVVADKADFIVFYVPPRENVAFFREKGAPARDEAALGRITADLNIPFFSLTPVLAGLNLDVSQLYFTEGHWNATAHKAVAAYAADIVAGRLQTK